jgi:uncharacterized protein (DUF1786 family)
MFLPSKEDEEEFELFETMKTSVSDLENLYPKIHELSTNDPITIDRIQRNQLEKVKSFILRYARNDEIKKLSHLFVQISPRALLFVVRALIQIDVDMEHRMIQMCVQQALSSRRDISDRTLLKIFIYLQNEDFADALISSTNKINWRAWNEQEAYLMFVRVRAGYDPLSPSTCTKDDARVFVDHSEKSQSIQMVQEWRKWAETKIEQD